MITTIEMVDGEPWLKFDAEKPADRQVLNALTWSFGASNQYASVSVHNKLTSVTIPIRLIQRQVVVPISLTTFPPLLNDKGWNA